MIIMGFYLMVTDDSFRSVETFYQVLFKQSDLLLWRFSCHIGLGLIEYYKKNYPAAIEQF